MLKAKNLRDQTIEELEATIQETRKELYLLNNEKKQTKKLKTPHLLRVKKKDIAKLLTVIREKQLAKS